MPIRLTGINSGLDTETIISALVSGYKYKKEKYEKAQTKLSWKQDAWKSLNTKIYSLYTSVGNLRFSKAYNAKKTSVSDMTKATVKASNTAPNGTHKLNIIETAKAGYLTGGKLAGGTSSSTTLAELGYTGGDGTINVKVGDQTKSVTVSQSTTINSFISSLKDAGVNANYDDVNKRIYVSSKETGASNDFTLMGANLDGSTALSKLGLNAESDSATAAYKDVAKYAYTGYDMTTGTALSSVDEIKSNIGAALTDYTNALNDYNAAKAENENLAAAYGYSSAYASMKDTLASSGLDAEGQKQLEALLKMSASDRNSSIIDADGNIYTKSATSDAGNTIYSSETADGTKYIEKVVTYAGSDGNTYELNDDGTYTADGKTYKATKEKDADGNILYANVDDATDKITISLSTEYFEVEKYQKPTGYMKFTTTTGEEYCQNEDSKGFYQGPDGKYYKLAADKTYLREVDIETGSYTKPANYVRNFTQSEITVDAYTTPTGTALTDTETATERLNSVLETSTLTDEQKKELSNNVAAVAKYENAKNVEDADGRAEIIAKIQGEYSTGGTEAVKTLVNTYASTISANNTVMEEKQEIIEKHSALADIAKLETDTEKDAAVTAFTNQVVSSQEILKSSTANSDAKKIDGCDAVIKLNGVTYTGSSNSFSINGLSITAQGITGDGDDNAITITTDTDAQGIYDRIRDFISQYNALINEMTSLYNADTAKGYEPLTEDEKNEMSDKEVEKWEQKIKDSILRRDSTLSSVMNSMINVMSKSFTINDKTYSLSSFGIKTMGFLNAAENEQNAYHIDGDEDDENTSGNTDKLMKAITEDPDTVIKFMTELTSNLYSEVDAKMKSTSLSSVYKVYNDKQMSEEYKNYTTLIKKWENILSEKEDYYYKKFSAMEVALSKLNSTSSSFANYL